MFPSVAAFGADRAVTCFVRDSKADRGACRVLSIGTGGAVTTASWSAFYTSALHVSARGGVETAALSSSLGLVVRVALQPVLVTHLPR